MKSPRRLQERAVAVEALEGVLPVQRGTVGSDELLAQGLKVEGVIAGNVLRKGVWEVVEGAGPDDAEASIESLQVLAQGR